MLGLVRSRYSTGPTHTGKSTCLDLVRHFLGFDNVSSVSLHALDDESLRFSSAALFGKLANISADLSSKHLAGDSIAKQIASGDSIAGEFKNRAISRFLRSLRYGTPPTNFPSPRDRTDAWYERLVIIPFIRQHKGERADRNLLSKLTQPEEMSGILNKVVEALRILLTENKFRTTESTDAMLEEYKLENDQVSRFLSDRCKLDGQSETDESKLYTAYNDWCETEGIHKSLSKAKFRDGVKAWGGVHKRIVEDHKRRFVYGNIYWFG